MLRAACSACDACAEPCATASDCSGGAPTGCLPSLPFRGSPPMHPPAQKAKWDGYLKWGIEYDCPIFPGLFKFCRQYAAASIGAPRLPLAGERRQQWGAGLPAGRGRAGLPRMRHLAVCGGGGMAGRLLLTARRMCAPRAPSACLAAQTARAS